MFTVEDKPDGSVVITTLDEEAKLEDLEVYIKDGTVFLRQFCEELNEHQLCIINISQLLDVVTALDSAPGIYRTKIVKEVSK